MVAIDDIRDETSFSRWLQETNQPREACIALAHRAAMRILPVAWAYAIENTPPLVIPVLRAHLIAGVAGCGPVGLRTGEGQASALREAAEAAARDAGFPPTRGARDAAGSIILSPEDFTRSAAENAAKAAGAATWAAAENAPRDAADDAAFAVALANTTEVEWGELCSDCEGLRSGKPLADLPLFHGLQPLWASEMAILSHLGMEWSFWKHWYRNTLFGEPQNWRMLREIAIQPDKFWQGSDTEINARIAEIVARYEIEGSEPESLDAAIANSPNAERVEKTSNGLYDVVPVSEVLPEPFDQAVKRVRNALADIATLLGNPSGQQYYALQEVADLIGTELDRSIHAPMLIYEALMQALLDLDHLSEAGELPPSDRRIERFRTQFNNSALDILLNDQKVREAVTARAAFKISQLSPEEANQVRVLADALAKCSTPRLGNLLRQGSTTATSDKVSEEVRRIAIYEYGSRTIRMYGFDKDTFNKAANAASIGGFLGMLISWFV